MLKRWLPVLLSLIIFLMPSNLFWKFGVESAYVHGLQVDYLIPKIYASDVLILLFLSDWLLSHWTTVKAKLRHWFAKVPKWAVMFSAVLLFSFLVRQFFTEKPIAAVWFAIKLLEISLFACCLLHTPEFFKTKWFSRAWITTVLFQAALGLLQFLTQRSVFPSYLLLGEPRLLAKSGIAQGVWGSVLHILPYGTTSHPNVLGGVLAIGIVVLIYLWHREKNSIWQVAQVLAIGTGVITLVLTQSISAWLTLAIGLILLLTKTWWQKHPKTLALIILTGLIVIPLSINQLAAWLPESSSLARRAQLNQAAFRMIVDQPVVGVGLNNFTAQLENYARSNEVVRFVQPTHHVGALWLAETGLLGVAGVVALTFLTFRKKSLLSWPILFTLTIFLPILTLDHYLLTQQTGMLLVILSFYTFSKLVD